MKKKKNLKINSKKNNKMNNSLGFGFFVVPLIILVFIYAIVLNIMKDSYFYITPVYKKYQPIEKTDREPMENYFYDNSGELYDFALQKMVNNGAEYMYEKMGVLPYAFLTNVEKDESGKDMLPSEKDAEQHCKEICESLSSNGVNLVILFIPSGDTFKAYTYATDEVRAAYGKKLEKITKQYLMYNFNTVEDYGSLFEKTYHLASERILGGFTSPISIIKENLKIFVLGTLTIIVLVSSLIFYKKVGNKN